MFNLRILKIMKINHHTFLEHGCNASLIISNMINNLESLYVFFSASTKRYSVLNNEMEIENKLQLKNLSKTRWTARAKSIKAVWNSFVITYMYFFRKYLL